MSLIRRTDDPFFASIDRAFGRDVLDRFFGPGLARFADNQKLAFADWAPAVDVSEDDKGYHVHADLPKVAKEDVHVTVENGVLTLTGERRFEQTEKDEAKKYHRVERSYGRFQRSFQVPDDVDTAQVSAVFKDGVLEVTLPKTNGKHAGRLTVPVS